MHSACTKLCMYYDSVLLILQDQRLQPNIALTRSDMLNNCIKAYRSIVCIRVNDSCPPIHRVKTACPINYTDLTFCL